MSAASAPFMRVLMGTITAPAQWMPRAASTQSMQLGAQMATLSPGWMPWASSARLTARAWSGSSA